VKHFPAAIPFLEGGRSMLFVALMKVRAGTEEERLTRRLQWQYPAEMCVLAEYWLNTTDPQIITIFEADSFAPMSQVTSSWDDVYDITITPAVTAEEGIKQAREMME